MIELQRRATKEKPLPMDFGFGKFYVATWGEAWQILNERVDDDQRERINKQAEELAKELGWGEESAQIMSATSIAREKKRRRRR